jgi:hypothetical protein
MLTLFFVTFPARVCSCRSRPVWSSQSGDLTNAEDALLEKVRLLSVMEQVFRRQSKDRTVPFSDLAAAANIAVDEVRTSTMRPIVLVISGSFYHLVLQLLRHVQHTCGVEIATRRITHPPPPTTLPHHTAPHEHTTITRTRLRCL